MENPGDLYVIKVKAKVHGRSYLWTSTKGASSIAIACASQFVEILQAHEHRTLFIVLLIYEGQHKYSVSAFQRKITLVSQYGCERLKSSYC